MRHAFAVSARRPTAPRAGTRRMPCLLAYSAVIRPGLPRLDRTVQREVIALITEPAPFERASLNRMLPAVAPGAPIRPPHHSGRRRRPGGGRTRIPPSGARANGSLPIVPAWRRRPLRAAPPHLLRSTLRHEGRPELSHPRGARKSLTLFGIAPHAWRLHHVGLRRTDVPVRRRVGRTRPASRPIMTLGRLSFPAQVPLGVAVVGGSPGLVPVPPERELHPLFLARGQPHYRVQLQVGT